MRVSPFLRKFLTAILVSVFALASWAGEDVKEVTNAKRVVGKPMTIKLVEELRIGSEDDEENFLWVGPEVSVDSAANGHMFVTDTAENRIVELDASGNFVAIHGGKGEGPGEFQFLRSFQILNDGRGFAFESMGPNNSMVWYDKDMKPGDKQGRGMNLQRMLQNLIYSPDGKHAYGMYASLTDMQKQTTSVSFAIFDGELNEKKKLVGYDNPPLDQSRMMDPAFWVDYLSNDIRKNGEGNVAMVAFGSDGKIYTALAKHYKITRWNQNLEKEMVFGRKYSPVPLTEKDLENITEPIVEAIRSRAPMLQNIVTKEVVNKAVQKADLPPVKNPVNGIKVTPDNYVLIDFDADLSTMTSSIDIFDPNGKFVGNFKHPSYGFGKLVFKNGKAYTIETDEDGENYLVRYQVKMLKGDIDG